MPHQKTDGAYACKHLCNLKRKRPTINCSFGPSDIWSGIVSTSFIFHPFYLIEFIENVNAADAKRTSAAL